LPEKSSYQPLSPTKNHIDSQKPLIDQPISSFKPQHNTFIERNTKIPKCFKCQGYGHITLDCVNRKVVTIANREINTIFEEEKEDIHESFEEESMGEPIYDEEYVGADICEVFKEKRNEYTIYDDEYVPGCHTPFFDQLLSFYSSFELILPSYFLNILQFISLHFISLFPNILPVYISTFYLFIFQLFTLIFSFLLVF